MSLKLLRDQVTANGAVISAAIAAGVGVKTPPPPPPPPPPTGATDAELAAVAADLAAQDATLQKAIDAAGAAGSGDPIPPGVPGAPKVDSLSTPTLSAGVKTPVTIKGTGFTGGSVVGTGGLTFANESVVDDQTITVDVTAAAAGQQLVGVAVGGVTSNELVLTVT